MKKTKKMISMLCVFVMTLMMALPALADTHQYSITITNSSDQLTMVGNTYDAYKVFDVTYAVEGGKTAYSYTVADAFKDFTYTAGQTSYTGKELITYVGTLTNDSDGLNQFATAVQAYIKTKNISAAGSATALEANTVTIGLRETGYYIVTATANESTQPPGTITALCSLTTVAPEANINLKAATPTIEKTVKENDSTNAYGKVASYGIGDTVEFLLKGTIPEYASQYTEYKYIIHDSMNDKLTLNENSFIVYTVDGLDTKTPVDSTKYTIKTGAATGDSCAFEVIFDNAWIKQNSKKNVYVTYDAILNEKAVSFSGQAAAFASNSAFIEYSRNPYGSDSIVTPASITKVYTHKFDVFKYSEAENVEAALAGAQFKLFSDAQCMTEIKLIASTNGYRVAKNGETAVDYVESNAVGNITIEGLDAAVYYLKETKAPDGYNLLTAPIKVAIIAEKNVEGTEITSVSWKQDDTAVDKIKILNQSGTLLPSTGGIGTRILYIIGGLLMLGAAVLLVTKKRTKNQE